MKHLRAQTNNQLVNQQKQNQATILTINFHLHKENIFHLLYDFLYTFHI